MMAGFGQTVKAQKKIEEVKEEVVSKPTNSKDPYAYLRQEQESMSHIFKTHFFVGCSGHDGTAKSAIFLDAFDKDTTKPEGAVTHAIDFDNGVGMLNSAIYDNPNVKSWNPWQMGIRDRTAYDYPGTHQRVMDIMKFIISEVENGVPVWGVLVSGLASWLEICTNNMRIIDLGLAKDGIDAADNRGAGEAKRVERQSDWAIRNTRFHQLTKLSRDLVRLGVRVFWETHQRNTNFSFTKDAETSWQPEWEKKTNNYLPTLIRMDATNEFNDEDELVSTKYTATYTKCKTNPSLVNQTRTVMVTYTNAEPKWYGLPDLYDGTL